MGILKSANTLKTFASWTGVLVACLVMSACGFALRGSQALPENLTHVVINAPLQYSGLSQALEERLPVYQLQSVIGLNRLEPNISADSVVVVNLQPEGFERRLLSVFSTGQVAEYELVYSISYQVSFPGKVPISNTMIVSREYQDDPDQILAKSRELDLVLDELRVESADRIIRLLSNQFNSSQVDPNQSSLISLSTINVQVN